MSEVPLYDTREKVLRPWHEVESYRKSRTSTATSARPLPLTPRPSYECYTRENVSGDAIPCRMTGVTLHSHVHYKEIQACTCSGGILQLLYGGADRVHPENARKSGRHRA